MDIRHLQAAWNRFGETDPLWAILTHPARKGGRWDIADFFETGRVEVAAVMDYLGALPIGLQRGRVLDFGCGVGRLTQAFCDHAAECHGVDIAPSMIRLARRYNRFGERARYHLNERPDLSLFADDTFDLVYSNLVLQHMNPRYSAAYIREFMRILKPGGIAVFQLPGEHRAAGDLPAADVPLLPASAFRARIRPSSVPRRMLAGSRATITVRVQNLGDVAWPAAQTPHDRFRIELGNHWLDRDGRTVCNDDGRAALPCTVHPRQDVSLSLAISAPDAIGSYDLELDMVQEQVAWFQSRGSAASRSRITIADRHRPWHRAVDFLRQPAPRDAPEPVMEMYGIPYPEVVHLLTAADGRLVDAQRYDAAGEQWISYRYCVVK